MKGTLDVPGAFGILRDHGEGEYRPDSHLLGNRLCAHAGNRLFRNVTQTVGSLVAHLKPGIQTYWATGTSAPCIGIFKPIWFGDPALPDLGASPTGNFDPKSLWWHHESLHRAVLQDFPTRSKAFQGERDGLEKEILMKASERSSRECGELTAVAFQTAWEKTAEWTELVRELPVNTRPGFFYTRYWKRQNRKASLTID